MKNKNLLLIGGIAVAAAWCAVAFVFICEDDEKMFPKTRAKNVSAESEISAESAIPPAEDAEISDSEEPALGVFAEESAEPAEGVPAQIQSASRSAKIPAKAPRPAIAAFHCKGEICVDAATGKILSGTNVSAKCPPASVTKLMTLYVVLDAVSAGALKPEDVVIASRRAQEMGGTQVYLAAGEPCTVRDLIYALMVESANDAAVALAESLCGSVEDFVAVMNKTARALGMTNSTFATPHGLPPSRKARAAGAKPDMTTAEDLAKLAVALLKRFPETLEYSSAQTRQFPANAVRKAPLGMRNHNKLLALFAGCDGLKTGWTNDGASIVTTASRGNGRVVAVVLGGLVRNKKGEIDAKSSQTERNQRAAELMFNGFKTLNLLQYEPTPFKK